MENPKFIKQISFDNSSNFLLCDSFIHQTFNDCVIVGHSSLRLILMQGNEINEVSRYDHNHPIISAAVHYVHGMPEICFISGQQMFFAKPTMTNFIISEPIPLSYKFSSVISNNSLICLYPHNSSLFFYQKENGTFIQFDLPQNTKIWSSAFLNEYLSILEYRNVFYVKIYTTNDLSSIRCVASFAINYFTPYKVVSIKMHNSFYLLCESAFFKIDGNSSKGFSMDKFQIDIRNSDPLIVDSAPCGVRLLLLSADGLILRFDGQKVELLTEINAATSIASLTISRFLVILESCRICLLDRECIQMHEIEYANCAYSSFTPSNFIVASKNSIYSTFYNYGIEVEKAAQMKINILPKFFVFKELIFILFSEKTVVIDSEFRDITPSQIKHKSFERIHANSQHSFFALTPSEITIYEYGALFTYNEETTLSAHRMNTLYTCQGRTLTSFLSCRSTLIKQNSKQFESEIYSLYVSENIFLSFPNGVVFIIDDEFNSISQTKFDFDIFSIVQTSSKLFFGTDSGEVLIVDNDSNHINFNEHNADINTIGISRVYLCNVGNEVTAFCGKNYYYLKEKDHKITIRKLPPDFSFFSAFGYNSIFIALQKCSHKSKFYNLITILFTDQKSGFHHSKNIEFNQQITKLSSSKSSSEYVCCLNKTTLFWSRGEVKYNVLEDEEVNSINEWKALHNGKLVQFWVACTTKNKNEGRLLIFLQSRRTNSVQPLLEKNFESPIVAFSISSSSLAFFVMNDTINGISLETGSLKSKAKINTKLSDIVAIDCSSKYIAVLSNQRRFALFQIISDMELKILDIVDKPEIYGRIKLLSKYIAVSSRVNPILLIYQISQNNKLQIMKEVHLLSPVSSIFNLNGLFFLNCICGELYLVDLNSMNEQNSNNFDNQSKFDVSNIFSFSLSMLSLND